MRQLCKEGKFTQSVTVRKSRSGERTFKNSCSSTIFVVVAKNGKKVAIIGTELNIYFEERL